MWCKILAMLILTSVCASGPVHAEQSVWHFDNLKKIGGFKVQTDGHPVAIHTPFGKGIQFSGVGDSIFIDGRPLVGASSFTLEVIFRPDGGDFAQRFIHVAETDPTTGLDTPADGANDTNGRFMFEVRVKDGYWYLDTYLKSQSGGQTLAFENKHYPLGQWYAIAQTYDGTTYRAYVNGELQGEAVVGFKPHGPGHVRVGARMNKTYYFKGAVAEARFTDRALPSSELLKVSTAEASGTTRDK